MITTTCKEMYFFLDAWCAN